MIVQIHLQQNRTDLAIKEVQAARRWAQDSLLVNLAESWVGVRVVSYLMAGYLTTLADISSSLGRRKISAGILRLRRARASPRHLFDTESRRPGRLRTAPRPRGGGTVRSGAGPKEGAQLRRRHCQHAGAYRCFGRRPQATHRVCRKKTPQPARRMEFR